MQSITLYALAKELGLRQRDVWQMCRDVGLPQTRMTAQLTPGQAERVRAHAREKAEREARRAAAPRLPRAATTGPPPERSDSAPSLPRQAPPVPAVGPRHACECCGLEMGSVGQRLQAERQPVRCLPCSGHYAVAGEDEGRRVARLLDHEERVRHAYARTWSAAMQYEERMKAALHTRDSWRGAAVEVILAHEEKGTGGCSCGAKVFPCFTWKTLEQVNRGIARRVETYGAMKDEERDRALYGEDHWDYDVVA